MESRLNREQVRSFYILGLLFAINTMNFFDRQVLAAVTEPLRHEWRLTDTQLGWLGTSFTLLYAATGIPLGRLADLWNRKRLMALGLTLWSGLTYISGLCRGFWPLFAVRLGVGIGEASCAPTSTSLIGDIFTPPQRARAMSVFMLGLPVGLSLSYILSGAIAQHLGWRYAFFLAGIPGLVLASLILTIREPERGASESRPIGAERREGSPYLLVLGIPTMWWIIASGAIHNFNLYGLGSFLPAFLTRYHDVTVQMAGLISGAIIGVLGSMGMFLGGWLGDLVMARWPNGRLLLAGSSLLLSAPLGFLALHQPSGALVSFVGLLGVSYLLMYTYYATVYATIHDIVEPSLRGTAMALYFFAMYLMGASLGPLGTGWLSDFLGRRAASAANVVLTDSSAVPEQFRAMGLHQAMYLIPFLTVVLAVILYMGALTVGRDMERLQQWMNQTAEGKRDRLD